MKPDQKPPKSINQTASKTPLSEIGEFALIRRLTALAPPLADRRITGPGDDCAVIAAELLAPGGADTRLLVTTDSLIENRHFRLDYSSFFDVGWKSLAVSLSDIAAMGGTAIGAVLSLHLPSSLAVEDLEELYRGIYALARHHGVLILGGDTVLAKEFAVCLTAFGTTAGEPIRRSGALPGDELWLSGEVGGAGAGLELLKQGGSLDDCAKSILLRHQRPEPRLVLADLLLRTGAVSAMIDISDGLLQDAGHIAEQSGVQCVISLNDVPFADGVLGMGISRLTAASSGDDYELLFCAPKAAAGTVTALSEQAHSSGVLPRLTRIGYVRKGDLNGTLVMLAEDDGRLRPSGEALAAAGNKSSGGYSHF